MGDHLGIGDILVGGRHLRLVPSVFPLLEDHRLADAGHRADGYHHAGHVDPNGDRYGSRPGYRGNPPMDQGRTFHDRVPLARLRVRGTRVGDSGDEDGHTRGTSYIALAG